MSDKYKEMLKEWSELQNKVKEIVEKTGQRCAIIYSAFPGYLGKSPIDNLDEIAIKGAVKFIKNPDSFTSVKYESEVIRNPTWKDVCILANEMVLQTGDLQLHYLEDIDIIDKSYEVKIAKFVMGNY